MLRCASLVELLRRLATIQRPTGAGFFNDASQNLSATLRAALQVFRRIRAQRDPLYGQNGSHF